MKNSDAWTKTLGNKFGLEAAAYEINVTTEPSYGENEVSQTEH